MNCKEDINTQLDKKESKLNYVWMIDDIETKLTSNRESPTFQGEGDAVWQIQMSKYYISDDIYDVGLYLKRCDSGTSRVEARFTFSISAPGGLVVRIRDTHSFLTFDEDQDIHGFSNFIEHHYVVEIGKGGTWIIKVDIDAKEYLERSAPFEKAAPTNGLVENLAHLLETGDYSDFTIHCNNKEFKVHKVILAARSAVFGAMITANMKENNLNRVEMNDLDENVVIELLRFMYTDISTIQTTLKQDKEKRAAQRNLTIGLLEAAEKYQVTKLKSICEKELNDLLTVDSVVEILSMADLYNLTDLKRGAIRLLNNHASQIFSKTSWKQLIKQKPELVAEVLEDFGECISKYERQAYPLSNYNQDSNYNQ